MLKPLVICYCVENSLTAKQKEALEREIALAYQQCFTSFESCKVVWMKVPERQAYLDTAMSTTSTLMAPVPEGTPQDLRRDFLYLLLDKWSLLAECSRDDVVITAPDESLAKEFLSTSRNRMPLPSQISYLLVLITRLVTSRFKNNRLESLVNF